MREADSKYTFTDTIFHGILWSSRFYIFIHHFDIVSELLLLELFIYFQRNTYIAGSYFDS